VQPLLSPSLATGARAVTARGRGSAGPAGERPSYLGAEIERMKRAYEVSNWLWWVCGGCRV
jgi:hypothetical protein